MNLHTLNSARKAKEEQIKIEIDNPGKSFTKDGPWEEWKKEWVNTGWSNENGKCSIPKNAYMIRGAQISKERPPWGKKIHQALIITWQREETQNNRGMQLQDIINHRPIPFKTHKDTRVLYTDGGHDAQSMEAIAGFGYSIISGGDGKSDESAWILHEGAGPVCIDEHEPQYVGAQKHTNNTGEITAAIEGMRKLLEIGKSTIPEILIRPDSKLTMDLIIGDIQPKKKILLVEFARNIYKRLTQRHPGKVSWSHIKSHSGHKWNDRVDALAEWGAEIQAEQATPDTTTWKEIRNDGKLIAPQERWGANSTLQTSYTDDGDEIEIIQKITHNGGKTWRIKPFTAPWDTVNTLATNTHEISRIERTTDPFGTLNLIPVHCITNEQIEQAEKETEKEIDKVREETGTERWQRAREKTKNDATILKSVTKRKNIVAALDKANITWSIECPIDTRAVTDYIQSTTSDIDHGQDSNNKGKTRRKTAKQLIQRVTQEGKTDTQGNHWIHIDWSHCAIGRRMVAAGHITQSREYAKGTDPFKCGTIIRQIAMSKFGLEGDDAGSFPNAGVQMCPIGKSTCEIFTENRDSIMKQLGECYFPHLPYSITRERIKTLINKLDNSGSFNTWRHEWGLPDNVTPEQGKLRSQRDEGIILGLSGPDKYGYKLPWKIIKHIASYGTRKTTFSFGEYVQIQPNRSAWIADNNPRAVNMIALIRSDERDRPEVTTKSFFLQEYEGIAREAKKQWATNTGHTIFSLQHDGIVTNSFPGETEETIRLQIEQATCEALGYTQPVKIKAMPLPNGSTNHVWEDRPVPHPSKGRILIEGRGGKPGQGNTWTTTQAITIVGKSSEAVQQTWQRTIGSASHTHSLVKKTIINEIKRGYINTEYSSGWHTEEVQPETTYETDTQIEIDTQEGINTPRAQTPTQKSEEYEVNEPTTIIRNQNKTHKGKEREPMTQNAEQQRANIIARRTREVKANGKMNRKITVRGLSADCEYLYNLIHGREGGCGT